MTSYENYDALEDAVEMLRRMDLEDARKQAAATRRKVDCNSPKHRMRLARARSYLRFVPAGDTGGPTDA